VGRLLESASDAALRRFRESWLQDKQRRAEQQPYNSLRDRMIATPAKEILRAAEGEGGQFWLRSWGIHANEADLRAVLQRLWAVREPRIIANLLQVFSARALPKF